MHLGKVLDWPFLYNLADAYVCIGMGILIVQSLINDKKRPAAPQAATPPAPSAPPQSE
jgi:lipoprotein signal peptidase